MPQTTKYIFLTGAPESDQLEWSESNLLSRSDLELQSRTIDKDPRPTPSFNVPKWRLIPFDDHQADKVDDEPKTQFISFAQHPTNTYDQDFLEHSLFLHEEIGSSQIAPTTATAPEALDETTLSFLSNISDTSLFLSASPENHIPPNPGGPGALTLHGNITDLRSIPTAFHLERLYPQTVTLNFLCGVISITSPRTVTCRRRPGQRGLPTEKEIIEVLLGDETRAGFSVSFWLTPLPDQARGAAKAAKKAIPEDHDLRRALQLLRLGDVVLLRNLALSAWNNCVFGQSLSKRFARNRTEIDVVRNREAAGGHLVPGLAAETLVPVMQAKFRRVKEWSEQFAGGGRKRSAVDLAGDGMLKGRVKRLQREVLPPDESQDRD